MLKVRKKRDFKFDTKRCGPPNGVQETNYKTAIQRVENLT